VGFFDRMAVAKGRGATAVHTLPPDMQTALKRNENLEVELRSLKMTLQFMNRYCHLLNVCETICCLN
jgi:hypothetical protein